MKKIPYWYVAATPWILFGAGFLMNAVVMAFNGAQMPVLLPGGHNVISDEDIVHTAMTATTHLRFLADWIVINDVGIASPGDFLEWLYSYTWMPAAIAWLTLILSR